METQYLEPAMALATSQYPWTFPGANAVPTTGTAALSSIVSYADQASVPAATAIPGAPTGQRWVIKCEPTNNVLFKFWAGDVASREFIGRIWVIDSLPWRDRVVWLGTPLIDLEFTSGTTQIAAATAAALTTTAPEGGSLPTASMFWALPAIIASSDFTYSEPGAKIWGAATNAAPILQLDHVGGHHLIVELSNTNHGGTASTRCGFMYRFA